MSQLSRSTCHKAWLTSRIYAELADQYKVLDAASAAAKRKVLAEHLKEVIDTLEQKVSSLPSRLDSGLMPRRTRLLDSTIS